MEVLETRGRDGLDSAVDLVASLLERASAMQDVRPM